MWFVCVQIRSESSTTKEKEIKQKNPKKEDKFKRILTEANQEWNYSKFQINHNILGWVNPRSRDEIKNSFCVS